MYGKHLLPVGKKDIRMMDFVEQDVEEIITPMCMQPWIACRTKNELILQA